MLAALVSMSGGSLWSLWNEPSYPFAALIGLAGVGGLAWNRWDVWNAPPSVDRGSWIAAVVAIGLVLFAAVTGSPTLAFLSLLVSLPLASYALGGRTWLSAAAPIVFVLAPLAHWPLDAAHRFTALTQAAAGRGADKALDLRDVFHVLQGDVVAVS